MSRLAAILGLEGPALSAEERAFFRDVKPWGFILFRRNIETPDQVRGLVESLRDCVGRPDAPVLVDQEGGRVARFGPPHWPIYPPGRAYGALGPVRGREAARLGARLIAADLAAVGVNVDCVPVLDVPQPGAHDVIGDRAYGETAAMVGLLGRAACEGLIAGGVLPVIKHIPGHGRAGADSHHDLPVVDAARDVLEAVDFEAFRHVSDMPLAMTAHVVYTAIDRRRCATVSRRVISKVIRQSIGFDGLLMSDDLSMKALGGDFGSRTRQALSAGCDVVLHCNGDMTEMKAVASAAGALRGRAARRAELALARAPKAAEPFDAAEARARLLEAMRGVWEP